MTLAELNEFLVCPVCQTGLSERRDPVALACASCGASYPVRDGIPRFVSAHYAENFRLEWTEHRGTQFDGQGATLSRDQFLRYTGWDADSLAGKRVLDAGCGSGRFSKVALDLGAMVVAVDLSEAVEAARANLIDSKSFEAVQADLVSLPFRPRTFDAVFSIGVLQHTPDPYACLASLLRQCNRGGRVALWFYGYRNPLQLLLGLMHMKYFLRPVLRHVAPRRLYAFVRWYVPKLLPLSRWIRNRTHTCRIPIHEILVPVANRDDAAGDDEHLRMEMAILDTFDWYSPRYDQPLSEKRVERILRAEGFDRIARTSQGGMTARRKPAEPSDPGHIKVA